MHIPDGFLSLAVALVGWVVAAVGVGLALWRSREALGERQVPLMGVLAAFIFAAQMLNFTVAGGTSGHLLGGALAAILLGPWAGILTMTTVVAVQALLFQDGGLLVMGANITNMAVIACLVGYGVYRGVRLLVGERRWSLLAGGFAAAWASVVAAAAACAIELGFSGTSPIGVALPAMAGIHALIGIGEGLITVGALALVSRARPDLVEMGRAGSVGGFRWALTGLAVALALTLLSPLASPHPDGLERVAEDLGFIEAAQEAPFEVIPDYVFPGLSNEALATIVAGVVGTIIVFGIAVGVAALYRRRVAVEA
ncbi:MAG TPA: cobalamin biosynthesis protein CbiM [Thermoflexia bacterium]|jgi:cobalt/nickel transport system permease protein|nr:cobalamin biosynthesis protein CbiM [Thermoflexia bacterium]